MILYQKQTTNDDDDDGSDGISFDTFSENKTGN